MPLASGSAGLQTITLVPSTPRNAWHSAVSSVRPARHRPTAPSPSQTSTRGTAPSAAISCHQPANRSSARRVGISTADSHREYPQHHRQHRQLLRRAGLPEPDRQLDRREPQIALRDLPGRIARARRPDPAADTPAAAPRTRSLNTVIQRVQPIRSAITVAGIVGTSLQQLPDRGSTASTTDPAGCRSYFGGPSEANAARTVFLETPNIPRDHLDRHPLRPMQPRISAQSSTANNSLLLSARKPRLRRRGSKFGRRHGVSFQASPTPRTAVVR